MDKTENFITRGKNVHGNKFNYSKTVYVNNRTKVTIICNTCNNEFQQTPGNHLSGGGCPRCKFANQTKTTEEFIDQAIQKNGNKFNYSKTIYVNSKTKVIIGCNTCNNEFQQRPKDHLSGHGCPHCANTTKTTDKFIDQAIQKNGNKFNYSKTVYVNNRTKVTIICNTCNNDFQQRPKDHLSGHGCPHCANTTKTTDKFIDQAIQKNGNKFNYSKTVYVHSKTKVTIICNTCNNEFQQRPDHHLQGKGCPTCSMKLSNSISKGETLWLDILGIKIRNKQLPLANGKTFKPDGYDPKTNTVYEYHGDYWHGNPKIFKPTDINTRNGKTFGELYKQTVKREKDIIKSGYKLAVIWESEFIEKYADKIDANLVLQIPSPYDLLFS